MLGYLITNTVNGKRYVGKTSRTIKHRWNQHLTAMRSGASSYLYNAMRKYGIENFTIVPIRPLEYDITTDAELNEWEREMIRAVGAKYPKGYNLTDGGDGGNISEPTRQKMRQNMLGNCRGLGHVVSTENRARLSKRMSERVVTASTRAKIVEARLGTTTPIETRKRMSTTHKARLANPEIRAAHNLQTWHNRWHGKCGSPNPKCSLCTLPPNDPDAPMFV